VDTAIIVALIGAGATVIAAVISKRTSAPTSQPAVTHRPSPAPRADDTPESVTKLRHEFILFVQHAGKTMLDAQNLAREDYREVLSGLNRKKYRGDALSYIAGWTAYNPPAGEEARLARDRMYSAIKAEAIEYIQRDRDAYAAAGDPYPPGQVEATVAALVRMPPGEAMCKYLDKWFEHA